MVSVAWTEPRRALRRNRPAQGVAGRRSAAALAGDGRRERDIRRSRRRTAGCTRWARAATREYVIAFDAASGKKLWEVPNGRRFRNEQGDGPRSTPTVDGDRLYAFGGSGELTALDAATGNAHLVGQRRPAVRRQRRRTGATANRRSSSAIASCSTPAAGARRSSPSTRSTGKTLWQNHNDEAGYSSPMLLRTGSLRRSCSSRASARWPSIPRDGRLLWSYNRVANDTANIATPVVHGNRVFFSSDYGTGAALLDVKAAGNIASASEVYFTREMRNHHASSVRRRRHIYGFSSSILTALNFDTGELAWRNRSVGKGSLIYADERSVSLQRGRRGRSGRCGTRRLPRARPLLDPDVDATPRPGRIRSSRTAS